MTYSSFHAAFSRVLLATRRAVVCIAAIALCLGTVQPQAIAAPSTSTAGDQMAMESPSAEATADQRKAERRAAQSQRSQAADTDTEADTLSEVIEEKLNLDEIVEENVLLNDDAQPAARRK